MSTSATPISEALGSAGAPGMDHTKPTSLLGHDAADHAQGTTDYKATVDSNGNDRDTLLRSNSQMSQSATYIPSRGGTLKKKGSLHKASSVKRSGSRRSSYAGSVRSMKLGEKEKYEPADYNSVFYCPIPITGSPTELLANRFQAWRKVLKDLINYFRDLHKSFDSRSKAIVSASNVINNTVMPYDFLKSGGISDAADLMRNFHKQALAEAAKARDLENEVILQLTGLRSDLSQKIKEIKGLSGDFKNTIHKDQEGTRKAISTFQEALGHIDRDANAAAAGKGDPFLIKLGVERQLERQIEEENYLHRAFLNLEASGRELESIVVGEIQKAYNVLAGILKRDADINYDTAEKLREGPLAMNHDHEWDAFVTGNSNMVDPRQPLRQVQNITYEGKDHPAAIEVKSGMLERKSKYLKNYTPGWYILSPTHLHEFKSADQIAFQAPVMSLYLPEQKLGSHSEPGSSSHKFMLKGRQTGSMHRGHTWIFRAETHDTMMTWFSDIRELTEKRGEARNEFVRRTHARSLSAGSQRAASIGSAESHMDEDEADRTAFAGVESVRGLNLDQTSDAQMYTVGGATGSGLTGDDARSEVGWRPPQRPQPGGRFPSDVNVTRGLQAPLSPSSGDSGDENDREIIAAAAALPGSALPIVAATHDQDYSPSKQPVTPKKDLTTSNQPSKQHQDTITSTQTASKEHRGLFSSSTNTGTGYTAGEHSRVTADPTGAADVAPDTQSQYHEWVGTAGAALAGAGAGALGATAVQRHKQDTKSSEDARNEMLPSGPAIPSEGYSSAPIVTSNTESRQADFRPAPAAAPVVTPENDLRQADFRPAPVIHSVDRSPTPVGISNHPASTAQPDFHGTSTAPSAEYTPAPVASNVESRQADFRPAPIGSNSDETSAPAAGSQLVSRLADFREAPSTMSENHPLAPISVPNTESRQADLRTTPIVPSEDHSTAAVIARLHSTDASENHAAVPVLASSTESSQTGLRGLNESSGITASIYQQTTMPAMAAIGSPNIASTTSQSIPTGNLVSGTDVRASPGASSSSDSTPTSQFTPAPVQAETGRETPYSLPTSVSRPTPIHTKSVQTISDLHIPGEFPRSTASTPRGD